MTWHIYGGWKTVNPAIGRRTPNWKWRLTIRFWTPRVYFVRAKNVNAQEWAKIVEAGRKADEEFRKRKEREAKCPSRAAIEAQLMWTAQRLLGMPSKAPTATSPGESNPRLTP